MIDYGREASFVIKKIITKDPGRTAAFLEEFRRVWCRHEVFAPMVQGRPKWVLSRLTGGNQL
jgi:hypothetical protein